MLPINILCYVIITMSSIKDKIKEKVTDPKDKVVGATENVSDTVREKARRRRRSWDGVNTYKDSTRKMIKRSRCLQQR